MQKLRREVGPVWPCKRMAFYPELLEAIQVTQRNEDWAVERVRKIDFAERPVVEPQPYAMILDILRFDKVRKHF